MSELRKCLILESPTMKFNRKAYFHKFMNGTDNDIYAICQYTDGTVDAIELYKLKFYDWKEYETF